MYTCATFCTLLQVDLWGFPASPVNLIEPGKRPMSSMSPLIILNQRGEVAAVVGGTGGSRIITSTVYVS